MAPMVQRDAMRVSADSCLRPEETTVTALESMPLPGVASATPLEAASSPRRRRAVMRTWRFG